MKCYYCETPDDLRPYGPNHSMVCFKCAISTPEREATTSANFGLQLSACGAEAMIDGSSLGPYPAVHGAKIQ